MKKPCAIELHLYSGEKPPERQARGERQFPDSGIHSRFSRLRDSVGGMFGKLLFVAASLILPIAWGWFVYALFQFAERKSADEGSDDSIFPDFQI
jgi:hypothetical protein